MEWRALVGATHSRGRLCHICCEERDGSRARGRPEGRPYGVVSRVMGAGTKYVDATLNAQLTSLAQYQAEREGQQGG